MRDVTERPEAVEAGVVKLVGTLPARIVESVNAALAQPAHATRFDPDASPYGDGRASARIVARCAASRCPNSTPAIAAPASLPLLCTK